MTHLETLLAELNDKDSLVRSEIDAQRVSEVLPANIFIQYKPPVEHVCNACGAKVIDLCDCRLSYGDDE
ncbi:MAG TPA: hypothetical protein EYQ26_15495 [Rhodospirillales bacterium]|nr:hypothetical protein [Rhodospirillales bacterium]